MKSNNFFHLHLQLFVWKCTSYLLFSILLGAPTLVLAQVQRFRPATEAEFTGYWRIVLIPNEVHKSEFKNELMGYADPCQFFVHLGNGDWYNTSISNGAGIEESKRLCPVSREKIGVGLFGQKGSAYKWIKVPNQVGLYVIQAVDKSAALLWKADIATVDIAARPDYPVEFKKGDMMMQILKRRPDNTYASAWPMILRPIVD